MVITLGIAIPAMMMIMRMTITNSTNEKPRDASVSGDLVPAIDLVFSNRIVPRMFKVCRLRSIFNRVVTTDCNQKAKHREAFNQPIFSCLWQGNEEDER
jgi:hypothetical protein